MAVFVAAVFPTCGLAQGTVNFGSSDPVNHKVLFHWNQSPVPAGSTVELWYSPDGGQHYTRIANNVVGQNGWIYPAVVASAYPGNAGTSGWFYIAVETIYGSGRTANFLNPTANPFAQPPEPPAELSGWTSPLLAGCLDPGFVFITRSPTNKFVVVGDALTLNVDAWASCWPGSPYYQWYNSHGTIPAATNSSYVINPVQATHSDDYWAVVFTSFTRRTSEVATVTVLLPGSFGMETSGDMFGIRSNQFGFNIIGPTNLNVVVETSTNLANPSWLPVQTNTLTMGVSYFTDTQWTNYAARFYRLRWP